MYIIGVHDGGLPWTPIIHIRCGVFFREAREIAIAVCFTLLNVHNFQKYDRILVSDSFTEKLKLGFYRNFVYNNNINIINLRNEDDNFSIDRRDRKTFLINALRMGRSNSQYGGHPDTFSVMFKMSSFFYLRRKTFVLSDIVCLRHLTYSNNINLVLTVWLSLSERSIFE